MVRVTGSYIYVAINFLCRLLRLIELIMTSYEVQVHGLWHFILRIWSHSFHVFTNINIIFNFYLLIQDIKFVSIIKLTKSTIKIKKIFFLNLTEFYKTSS